MKKMQKPITIVICVLLTLSAAACLYFVLNQLPSNPMVAYAVEKVDDSIVAANTRFAFDIFKTLNQEAPKENIFISPLSISVALTMTYNGAETATREAMSETLQFGDIDREIINDSFFNLIAHLKDQDDQVSCTLANSIWIRDGEAIQEAFLEQNMRTFHAEIDALDFSQPEAVDTINDWISDATQSKIDKMLEPPIDPNVIMFLINAIHFKGQWLTPFDPKQSFDAYFNEQDGAEQPIRMMHRYDTVEYMRGSDYKAVRIPYGNDKTSMIAILPDENVDINEFVESMDESTWQEIRESLKATEKVTLRIPKFKMEYGIKELNDSLNTLGMGEAFDDQADFSGIRSGLYISAVLHKAVIEVNEEGSEAAAATVVIMRESAAMEPITFVADRPFLFMITDDVTGSILFMGKFASVEN